MARRYPRGGGVRRFVTAVAAIVLLAAAAVVAVWLEPDPVELSGRAIASDGDSLRVGDTRVRLLGIDAPELAQDCSRADGSSWPCGREARAEMARLLASGPLVCQSGEKDRFGRSLGTCTVGGTDLAAGIVAAGFAIATEGYGREQGQARSARRGIWQGEFEQPRSWRDRHPERASFIDMPPWLFPS